MTKIIANNTSLFRLAADELGDAMQWINIARVNGISDPFITNMVTVTIPEYSASLADGIGPQ